MLELAMWSTRPGCPDLRRELFSTWALLCFCGGLSRERNLRLIWLTISSARSSQYPGIEAGHTRLAGIKDAFSHNLGRELPRARTRCMAAFLHRRARNRSD